MWIAGIVFLAFMSFGAFLWGTAYANRMHESWLKSVLAVFSGPFASNVMGRCQSGACEAVEHIVFILLFWMIGASICFFGWKTRYAELCAGVFLTISLFVWFSESLVWLFWE